MAAGSSWVTGGSQGALAGVVVNDSLIMVDFINKASSNSKPTFIEAKTLIGKGIGVVDITNPAANALSDATDKPSDSPMSLINGATVKAAKKP